MRIKHVGSLAALALAGLLFLNGVSAQPPAGKDGKGKIGKGKAAPKEDNTPRGLRLNTAKAAPGYVLYAPLTTKETYLMNLEGQMVKTWNSDYLPAAFAYLMPNGHVLRGAEDLAVSGFSGGGAGGRLQEFDWDGKLVWDFAYNTTRLTHHDAVVMPNGHILAIAWEKKTADEARAKGRRNPGANGVWPDVIVEFEKQGLNGARVVWEWHAWDHLVASEEAAAHPEKIDVNGDLLVASQAGGSEMFHVNSVFYNAKLDQIMLSVPRFNEIWIVDHGTSTAQAATGAGGKSGKGGDLLYRWGNPQTYGRGAEKDRLFGFEHDARWIDDGLPGAGHILVFSNRTPGPNGEASKVYEFAPPVDAQGRYTLPAQGPYGPAEPAWSYAAAEFNGTYISGAHRLKNGNTLITSGPQGRMFEVTPAGEIVWEYWNTFRGESLTGNRAANPFSVFRGQKVAPDYAGLNGRL